jgi:hypothetical protein
VRRPSLTVTSLLVAFYEVQGGSTACVKFRDVEPDKIAVTLDEKLGFPFEAMCLVMSAPEGLSLPGTRSNPDYGLAINSIASSTRCQKCRPSHKTHKVCPCAKPLQHHERPPGDPRLRSRKCETRQATCRQSLASFPTIPRRSSATPARAACGRPWVCGDHPRLSRTTMSSDLNVGTSSCSTWLGIDK